MPDEPTKVARKQPGGTSGSRPGLFLLKCAFLVGLTFLFYWIGWRSPWARADETVRVEVLDPPKPAPVAAPAQPPASQGAATKGTDDRADVRAGDRSVEASAELDNRVSDGHARRRGKRSHRSVSEADQPLD